MSPLLLIFVSLFSLILSDTILIGGNLNNDSPMIDLFKDKKMSFITAGGDFPDREAVMMKDFFLRRGINATWIPMYFPCNRRVMDPNLVRMVVESDFIYLGGGLSDKLQFCLLGDSTNGTNPFLQALQRKQVGGSSAGAMVLPHNNIFYTRTSPDSYNAVANGRVNSFGENGLKIYRRGIIDSHVGERGRQGRLYVLQVQTRTKYGFGIDENTGMIEKPNGDIHFMGQKGVAVFENPTNSFTDGLLHYLSEGDVLKSDGSIELASWKTACDTNDQPPPPSTSIFTQFRSVTIDLAKFKNRQRYIGISGRSPVVEIIFQRKDNGVTVCGSQNGNDYVSFTNMFVSMGRRFKKDGIVGDIEDLNKEEFLMDY